MASLLLLLNSPSYWSPAVAPALRSRPALVSRSAPAAVSMAFALPGFGGKKQAGPSEEARALYRELGLAEDADYDEINAVYEELEAKYKGDVKRIIKLKVARDKILEDRLRQRMQGTLQANDDVRVASDNFSDEKKPLIKLPRFLERITMFPTKDLMLKNAAVFAFVAFLPVLDKSWASTSLGLGFGVAMYLLYNRDEDAQRRPSSNEEMMEMNMRPAKTGPLLLTAGITFLAACIGVTLSLVFAGLFPGVMQELLISSSASLVWWFTCSFFKVNDD